MARLVIKRFSCIDDATIDLSPLTVLIGPQASGKSVISKLMYFFYNILEEQFSAVTEGKSLREFEASLASQFRRWFPPDAWGKRDFTIAFEAGVFQLRLKRKPSKRATSEVSFAFSHYFGSQYTRLLENVKGRSRNAKRRDPIAPYAFDLIWKIRNVAENRLRKDLRENYVDRQLFIPAGRSFFTSIGKAVTAFAESSVLDPLTIEFGKSFTSMREEWPYFIRYRDKPDTRDSKARLELMHELVGGEIKMARDREYVQTRDGRTIPFAVLSSGQQEVLPLYMALNFFTARLSRREGMRQLLYIEEPEAHLFPSSQKRLVEYLGSIVASQKDQHVNMLITTHSPYVLATLNNLMKAGALADSFGPGARRKINAIIPRVSWLRPNSVLAYAIYDGRLTPLIGKEGLIDAMYLDEVSGTISKDFLSLLEIENLYEKA